MQPGLDLRVQLRVFFIRFFNWEYWNSTLLYLPVLPYLLYLWIRSKSCFFFNAANPGIKNGGFIMESKWEMQNDAPDGFFPFAQLMKPEEEFTTQFREIEGRFRFPVIAKPVSGSKGQGVTLIADRWELCQYHRQCPVHYMVQEKINYPREAGIFYVRLPGEACGRITGIVEKEFVQVTGNGSDNVEALLLQNPRYLLQIKSLRRVIPRETLQMVIAKGEHKVLLDIGNHARGACFTNAGRHINALLTANIDKVCKKFPGFCFGRLDIRFNTWEQLYLGKEFAIIELNGAGSEPTHIYDPRHSVWYAWKEICRHWYWMYRISSYNHSKGVPYLSVTQGIQLLQSHIAYNKKMKTFAPAFAAKKDTALKMPAFYPVNTTH